ncbi:hypothetical protein LCGC14_3072260 [marine sediment metagenome]|uniref:Uncharacterized protein n=1 Tax=marine sediment metagenome TaxID=412755 RepID=A0A0F8X440_9ZZZZ
MIHRSDLIAVSLIVLMMAGAVSFVACGAYEQMAENEASPYIMIRKNSMERIMRSPCMVGTMEYMGNYILCRPCREIA